MKSVRYEGRIVGGKRAMHEGHVSLVGKWATIITSCVDVLSPHLMFVLLSSTVSPPLTGMTANEVFFSIPISDRIIRQTYLTFEGIVLFFFLSQN